MKVKKKVKIRKKQETIKNREWERERRGKLNVAFGQLDRLLPDHDPSQARSKVGVLVAAIGHIGHLHQVVATLSGHGGKDATQRDSVYVAELARLHERIDTLRARCQQLAQLLQMADIPVPAASSTAAPRAAKEPGVPIKWNGNITHKTVQRRIINSRKDKAEKKENKELPEVGSTAAKKRQQPKKKQQTIANPTKVTESEEKELSAKLMTSDDHDESTYLSPVKKVIDLCNTPLRELTGFTLNSASGVASSSSFPPSSSSSSISSPSSSLSSNSPAMSDTPINDGQSSMLAVKDFTETVMTSSAKDVAMETKDMMSSASGVAMETKDMMSSASGVAMETIDMTSLSDGNEQNANKLQTGLKSVPNQTSTSQSAVVGVVTPKSLSTVAVTTSSTEAVTTSSTEAVTTLSTEVVTTSSTVAATSSTGTFTTSSTVAVTTSLSSVAVTTSTGTVTTSSTVAVTSSSAVVSSSSGMGSSKSIEDKPNSAPNPAINSAPMVTQVPKKSASSKSRPKTVTGSKPVMVTTVGNSSNPIPVHVVNSMNPYPSIMPVTVTSSSLNFAAPSQSIMIVLPDGRVVSVPQQQPMQQQFVINRTINHQSPTTIVIGNSAPVIEPIVFEAAADGVTVNRAGQKRVLLSKQSNKVPIPMVGTQFVVRRTVEMKVKEKKVIEKRQKSKKLKKTVISAASTKVEDYVNVPAAVETARVTAANTVDVASDKDTKQLDVESPIDANEIERDEPSKKTNKDDDDDGNDQTTPSDGSDTSTSKVLGNTGVPKELSTNPGSKEPAESLISQNSIKSTEQDSSMGIPASGTDAETVQEGSLLNNNTASIPVAEGESSTTRTTTTTKVDPASRDFTSKPIQEVQEKLGDKDISQKVSTGDTERQQDRADLIEKLHQQNSATGQVENLDNDGNRLNIANKNDDDVDDNDHFGLDTMSDDDDDDDDTEHDRNISCSIVTKQMKRSSDSDDGPTLKKMKTSEEQNISTKMNLPPEDVLQQENFNMDVVGLISSNVDDVQMGSVCADVPFQESSNASSNVEVGMQQNPNQVEQRKLELSKHRNQPSSNCSGSVLEKNLMILGDKDCPIANEKETAVSSVVPNPIEMKFAVKPYQKPDELLLQDIGNRFPASKNPDTHQTMFETQIENIITNKDNERMRTDECSKRNLVRQSCQKVSNDPPTNSSQSLSLVPAASLHRLPNRPPIINNAAVKCILSAGTEQNPNNPISHSDTDTIKEVSFSSKTSSYAHHSAENSTKDDLVMETLQPVNISSCSLSKESIKTSGFLMVNNSATETLPTNTENSLESFVRDSNFVENGMFSLPVVNKETLRVAETAQANENTAKQRIDQSMKKNFVMELSSNQIGKSSFIGGDNTQQKIETQTSRIFDSKTDNNSFANSQQIVDKSLQHCVNNVSICPTLNNEQQCRQSMESTIMATNSQSQIGANFDSGMHSSSNYMNRNLPETTNLFWNNSAEQVIGSQAASSSMFPNAATNQNVLKCSESGVVGSSFMNYSNTISTSTTSITSTSSVMLPNFSMSLFANAAANQNVISSSNLNLLKSSESAVVSSFLNYSSANSTSTTSVTSTSATVLPNFPNKTSITPCGSSSNKLSIITEQRPIVSYKISDSGQKTVNSNPVSNVPAQSSTSEKQWNPKMKFPESFNKVGGGGLKYFQPGCPSSVVKQCDTYSLNKPSSEVHECQHHQKFQKLSQNRTIANTSKTIQTGEITKTTSVYNANTKMIGNKVKKDMSTNTSSEQPKVLYPSGQKMYLGNNSHDMARKQLETMDGINSDKNKDANKNMRKVLKKTVSQQTDDVNNGSMISGSKTDVRKVAGVYKMKSTSSCQTVEMATTKINTCEKYPNQFGRGTAQNKRKAATFQVGYNTGIQAQSSGKSTMQVGSSAVPSNKKSVSAGDTLLQNPNNMEMMNSLVPTSTQNSSASVQHSKSAEKQAAMFVTKNQESSKNVKKQDFKTVVPQLPKEKNAAFLDDIRLVLPNNDFSNDIFSSLQVPSGAQHHGSLSPTAAFLDAFPLVSNSKNSELLIDSENTDAVQHASETLLQLGETNILDTNITGRQDCQQVLNNYNSSNVAGAHLGMNNDEIAKNPSIKNNNSLHSGQLKTGSTVTGSNNSLPHQQLQTSSHSISVLNATKAIEEKCTDQPSKIQDYQSHYNVQYDYLSGNSFQNYNYNSGYKKVAPKFAETNYTGSAPAGINNTGFATSSQQFRDMNKMASTSYGQTNEGGLNYNTYSNWNTKPGMQLQNFDDFQTNYMSSYNHFPTSTSAPKNVFTSDPSFSTGTSMFGNLSTYKSMDTSATGNDSSGFVSQSLPAAASSGKKLGAKSSNNDAPANFIYTQASKSSNPVTTRSYSCVFSSASDFQASVGFPQPFYSSSTICAIDDPLNTPKVTASKDTVPGTVVTSSAVPIPTKSLNSSKSNSSNKFFAGANNNLDKKQPEMFDNSQNKTPGIDHQSTSKSSSYFPTSLNNSFSNNTNSTLLTGQNCYQTVGVFSGGGSSSSSGAITTTTLANSKDGSSGELVKTSTSTSSQPRVPVNWMTMPDPRTSTLEVATSSAPFIPPDRMFTPHKDVLDFIAPIITGCGNLQPTYSAINNSSQMFYGLDFPATDGQQPDVSNTKPITSTTANHQMQTPSSASSSLHYSWPTSKSSLSLLSHLDNHGLGIPSTLPTLVGDLALGTNTGPSTPAADGGYRVTSNTAANIFQTLPEVEERSNQLQSKPSDVPVKSSNYGLGLQPKPSSSFSTEVQSKSSNYSNAPSKFFNVQSKSSNFLDTPAKSSNFHPDMPSKSSNYLNAPSKPSNFFDVQSKSSNFIGTPSKSSNFTVDGQSNSTTLQFDRTNDAKILESPKNGKNQAQKPGQRCSVPDSSKMSATNHSQQSGGGSGGGSFLSVSQLVDQVKTNKKQDNGNNYKFMQNIMPPDNVYYPEISTNSGKQSGYKCNATPQKGVTNNFQTPINPKNANNPQTAQNRDSYNLLSFDGGTSNQKQNLLSFDGGTTNQKQNVLSFDSGTTHQKQTLLPFISNTNQKPKEASPPQRSIVNTTTRKSESMMQNNYNDLGSSFLTPSTSSFMATNSTSFATTSLITTNSTSSSSFMTSNSTLPIPVSMPSTASLWPQTSSNCANNNSSCPSLKKTDGFSTRPSSTYKGSNKYSAESLISSDRYVQDPTPNTDHFSTSTLNFGTCFETAGHNSTELPSFGTSSTLFGSTDYHHGDYGSTQNNQPMPSYQNYFGQTLDNLQPPNPSGFLADSADFQMNLFDSTTPYLFPAPSVPALNKKSTNTIEQKSNLKTNQKPANNTTSVFYPQTTMSLVPPSTNQQPANQRYQKSNSNFPPAPNCSSAANLPLSSSTTNSLANFNMSTIFPEMNDKVDAANGANRPHHHHMSRQSLATAVVAPQQQATATGDTTTSTTTNR